MAMGNLPCHKLSAESSRPGLCAGRQDMVGILVLQLSSPTLLRLGSHFMGSRRVGLKSQVAQILLESILSLEYSGHL